MMEPVRWRKSSRSNQETSCVELNATLDAVRDSKNGDILRLGIQATSDLLTWAKTH